MHAARDTTLHEKIRLNLPACTLHWAPPFYVRRMSFFTNLMLWDRKTNKTSSRQGNVHATLWMSADPSPPPLNNKMPCAGDPQDGWFACSRRAPTMSKVSEYFVVSLCWQESYFILLPSMTSSCACAVFLGLVRIPSRRNYSSEICSPRPWPIPLHHRPKHTKHHQTTTPDHHQIPPSNILPSGSVASWQLPPPCPSTPICIACWHCKPSLLNKSIRLQGSSSLKQAYTTSPKLTCSRVQGFGLTKGVQAGGSPASLSSTRGHFPYAIMIRSAFNSLVMQCSSFLQSCWSSTPGEGRHKLTS